MGRQALTEEGAHHGSDRIGQLHGLQLGHAEGGRAAHDHLWVRLQQCLQVPARQRLRVHEGNLPISQPRLMCSCSQLRLAADCEQA